MALANAAAIPALEPPPTNPNSTLLSSNNPFRARLGSKPATPPATATNAQQRQYPFPAPATTGGASTNPFLDPEQTGVRSAAGNGSERAQGANVRGAGGSGAAMGRIDDVFKDLSVSEKRPVQTQRQLSNRPDAPSSQQRLLGPDDRRDRLPRGPGRGPESPSKRPERKPEHRRRASDTSTMEIEKRDRRERQLDRGERPPRTESEERRRRERRKEREERHKREKERIAAGGKPRKPVRHLDIIDKLDVTGVYGQGLFHHDGPFDACNPVRNAKKDRRAPMQAFPEGSANMALGGAGPVSSRLDLDKFHGRTEEGFTDFNVAGKAGATASGYPLAPQRSQQQAGISAGSVQVMSTYDRVEQIHGEETYGLGTSTFLEGAPAPRRAAPQRRESEDPSWNIEGNSSGLARKKSLAQRIRGMSATRPRPTGPLFTDGPLSPTEGRYATAVVTPTEVTEPAQNRIPATYVIGGGSLSAQPPAYTREREVNPYDEAFDRKGSEIRFAEQEKPSSSEREVVRSPGSPGGSGLTRALTADAAAAVGGASGEEKTSGGFLNRMKSLKGKRGKLERGNSTY